MAAANGLRRAAEYRRQNSTTRWLQIEHQDRDIRWRDAADSAGLADGCRAEAVEFFFGFVTQLRHGEEIEHRRNVDRIDFLKSRNIGFLATDVTSVLSFDHHLSPRVGGEIHFRNLRELLIDFIPCDRIFAKQGNKDQCFVGQIIVFVKK